MSLHVYKLYAYHLCLSKILPHRQIFDRKTSNHQGLRKTDNFDVVPSKYINFLQFSQNLQVQRNFQEKIFPQDQNVSQSFQTAEREHLILMDRYLICQICGEKLSFDPYCTCALGEHLIKKHPGVEMTHFVVDDLSFCECDNDSGSLQDMGSNADGNYSRFAQGSGGKTNGIFKTTIETWKPGPQKLKCPLCGKEDRPCVRKQRNKVAYTRMGAMCMISCWPICFLPCLMPQASDINLYCKHCGAFLGGYNRKTGTLNAPGANATNKKLNVPHNLC